MNVIKENKIEHNYAIDILRIIMCLFVVMLHVCSYGICDETLVVTNVFGEFSEYHWYSIFYSFCRPAVIVFVMISGSYMLDPDKNVDGKFLKKHIYKMIKCFCFFSLSYAIFFSLFHYHFDGISISILDIIEDFANGRHLWYLYMIICLYILTPVLRRISSDESILNEFLIIGFIVNIIIPNFKTFVNSEIMNTVFENLHFELVTGYSFYYMLGYKIRNNINNKKINMNIIITIILYLISMFASMFLSINYRIVNNNVSSFPFYSYFFIAVLIEAVLIYSIFLYIGNNYSFKYKKIIKELSSYSSGIYYVHYGILSCLLMFFDFDFYAPIRIIILFVLTSLLSFICTFVIKKIPLFKKIM